MPLSKLSVLKVIGLILFLAACSPESTTNNDSQTAKRDSVIPKLSEYQGRWLILNYWAEWCTPCRDEIPELNELHAEGQALGVQVIGVNFDQPEAEELQRQIEALNVEFPVLAKSPSEAWGYELPQVLPSTLVFDPQGQLVNTLLGPQTLVSLKQAINKAEH